MARMAGSEDKEAGKGATDTNIVVTEGSFLTAVKEIGEATRAVDAANGVRKAIRKKWKASGISLGALDRATRMVEWDRQEVRESFSTEKRYAEWLGLPISMQADAFKGLSDDDIQNREWNAVGRSYSRAGKVGRPPEECPPDYMQAFMRGFNAEDESAWGDHDQPDVDKPDADAPAATAPDAEKPTVGDAVTGAAAGIAEGETLLSDIEGGTPTRGYFDQPDWKGFSDDPADWFAQQKATFSAWYESVPAGAQVLISHIGVREAFRAALREEAADPARAADAPTLEEVAATPEAPPALAGLGKAKGKGATPKGGTKLH